MFQHTAVSKSSAGTGFDEHARTKERMAPMLVGRSSAVASDEVVEEARADQRAEGRLAQLDGALDEVDRGDPVLAVARARSRR